MKKLEELIAEIPQGVLVPAAFIILYKIKPVVTWLFSYFTKADKDKDKKIKSQEKRIEELLTLFTKEISDHRTSFKSSGDSVNLTAATLLSKIDELQKYTVSIEISHVKLLTKFEERFGNVLELKAEVMGLRDEVQISNGKVIVVEQNYDKILHKLNELKKKPA